MCHFLGTSQQSGDIYNTSGDRCYVQYTLKKVRQSTSEKIYLTVAEASFSRRANWPWATSINLTAAASPFRLLSLDRLLGERVDT